MNSRHTGATSREAEAFQPAPGIFSAAFPGGRRRRAARRRPRGEIALMSAMLEDAMRCIERECLNRTPQARRVTREAREWVFADHPGWIFSFGNVCRVLGLDPELIRRTLKD